MAREVIKIDVSSPASVANMGAGYDSLALAVSLRNRFTMYVEMRPLETGESEFRFEIGGDYAGIDPRIRLANGNLFAEAFVRTRQELCEAQRLRIDKFPITVCQSVDIPPIRGLGSSSSAAVAGVAAAVEFLRCHYRDREFPGYRKDEDRELCASLAMAVDSCPDNVCAAMSGGLTYSFVPDKEPSDRRTYRALHYFHEDIDHPDLRIVALVPALQITTKEARKVLGNKQYSIKDVQFNIPRAVCIPAILRSRRYRLLRHALQDKIHQLPRAEEYFTLDKKYLDLEDVFREVVDAGAYGACVSGSGSTLVAFCATSDAIMVSESFVRAFEKRAANFIKLDRVYTLKVDGDGVAIERDSNNRGNAFQELTFYECTTEIAAWKAKASARNNTDQTESRIRSMPPAPSVPEPAPTPIELGPQRTEKQPAPPKKPWRIRMRWEFPRKDGKK